MKKIITILLTTFLCATATAQIENSIVLDRSTFRAVQTDALTGVNIDPIGSDLSRRPCARLKIFFHRMTREQMALLEPVYPSGTIDCTKCKVAEGNILAAGSVRSTLVPIFLRQRGRDIRPQHSQGISHPHSLRRAILYLLQRQSMAQ